MKSGDKISHYQILGKLGSGGMGEVYRARDSKLGRDVALKILPEQFAGDPERLARFQREARAVAALNHPNIVTLHSVEEADGVHFLTMELVEGKSLDRVIPASGMPVEQIIEIAGALVEALATAHEKGIVHRDLKPANVMVTGDGRVKVLDFGLAKETRAANPDDATLTSARQTGVGVVMGTPAYMSPEQALGLELDVRTDLFSFGAVLYEMATGRLAFPGQTTAAIHDAILNRQSLPVLSLNPDVPDELERIINKALEKDRNLRYQNASDLRADLQRLKRDSGSDKTAITHLETTAVNRPLLARRWGLLAALTVVLIALAGTSTFLYLRRGEQIDSIAVLPFANVSGDPNTEYLSDGISESLINSLAQLPNLRVVPRSVAFRYKGKEVDPQKAGKDLNVRSILMGKVVQRGDSLNVQAELVDTEKVSQLWGAQYNRKLADIQIVQEEITAEISDKLRLRLTGQEQKLLTKRPTENAEAYQLYLKGLYYWNKRTEEAYKRGIQCFNRPSIGTQALRWPTSGWPTPTTALSTAAIPPPGMFVPRREQRHSRLSNCRRTSLKPIVRWRL